MTLNICYKQIKGDYWKANYLGLEVVMKKSNSYVNASKLCTDGRKKFKHWLELKHSKEILAFYTAKIQNSQSNPTAVIPATGICIPKLIICVTGGGSAEDKIINGTYVHPKLIHYIATWVSVEFGDRVACILENFVNCEW